MMNALDAYNSGRDAVNVVDMSVHEHHRHDKVHLKLAVITASDSRTPETDESGRLIRQMLEAAGHQVGHHEIVPDDPAHLSQAVIDAVAQMDGVIITGGTGIA